MTNFDYSVIHGGIFDLSGPGEIVYLDSDKRKVVRYDFNVRKAMATHTFETNWGNEVTCLNIPEDNRHLLLMGYSDGVIEIRDT